MKVLESKVSGLLDASSVTAITSASVIDTQLLLVTKQGASGDAIKTAANVSITLTDTTATGTALKAIDDATTGVVNAASVTSITAASIAQAKQLLITNSATVTHAANVAVALTDTTAAATDLNAIKATTSGTVSAASLTDLSGAVSDVKTALEAITTGTALSATAINNITLTDAISASSLDNVTFANDAMLTLANVSGNVLVLTDATIASGRSLTIDGSTVSSAISLNASAEINGLVTLKGGAGSDTIYGGGGADTLTGNGGVDNFVFGADNRSTFAKMDTITDYRASAGNNGGARDIITVLDIVTVASNVNTVQNLSGQTTLADALNVIANASKIDNGLGLFIWGGNTYALIETTGDITGYIAGDTVIKIAGTSFADGQSIVGLGIDGV